MLNSKLLHFGLLSILALDVSCATWTGPLLTCPESIEVGEEVQLSASQVDDALVWNIDEPDEANAVFILPDGTESYQATTSNIGDSGFATGTTLITIRGVIAGTVRVHVQETTIGPGIGLPRPMGAASCTFEVREASE